MGNAAAGTCRRAGQQRRHYLEYDVQMDKMNWDAVLRIHLDSLFDMTKQVADGMVKRARGIQLHGPIRNSW